MLETDGYIVHDTSGIHFRSPNHSRILVQSLYTMKLMESIGKKVFSIITEGISHETHKSIPQCYYVSGELGYGKTTLLHRIKEQVESSNFQPIYIDCLLHPIPNEEKLEEYIHMVVTDQKRAILLLDEAHILLNTWSSQELSKLRALIYSPGAPIIVFAGNRVTKIFTEYSAPLYNSVLLLSLDKLAYTDIKSIIDNICGSNSTKHVDVVNIVNSLEPTPLIATLCGKAIKEGYHEEKDIKHQVLTYFNALYRKELSSLSPVQMLIVTTLLKAQTPCLLSDIANDTQLKNSDITAQIKRLKDRNLVEVIKGKPKKSLYQIKSNLLKAWYKESSIEKTDVASHF